MKKIILCLFVMLFSSNVLAAGVMSGDDEIVITPDLTLVAIIHHEENKPLKYTIDTKYPQLKGHLNASAKSFNRQIKALVDKRIAVFKKSIYESATAIQALPPEIKHNGFELDYDASNFKANSHILLSIRFNNGTYFAGAAHPLHDLQVYNFDLNTGKPLQLQSLFQPQSDYLKIISEYAREELPKKAQNNDKEWFAKGTEPTAKNYANWNLQSNGLLFTFDDYQVAAYVYGQPEVLVPYDEFKQVMMPTSLIAACVEDEDGCEED